MQVGSVSSSASASAGTQVRSARSPEQAPQGLQTVSAQKTQNTAPVAENGTTDRSRPPPEVSKPSVNTSGQTVGARINVTA